MTKIRLDQILVEKKLIESHKKAQALILAGQVMVQNIAIRKVGYLVSSTAEISIKETCPFVSRAGLKLEQARIDFGLNFYNKVALDVGSSTGGFSDCLLQSGAAKIFAIDIGNKQLHWKLHKEKKIILLEQTNFQTMSFNKIGEMVDLIVADVSFISLNLLLSQFTIFLKNGADLVILFKPQFEVGRENVSKGGKVKDEKLVSQTLDAFIKNFKTAGLELQNITKALIKGKKVGNQEYLLYFKFNKNKVAAIDN